MRKLPLKSIVPTRHAFLSESGFIRFKDYQDVLVLKPRQAIL